MKNDEIHSKVKTAFEHAAPDVLDTVISDIASGNFEKGKVLVLGGQKTMKNIARRITGIAAAALLLIGGGAGFAVYNNLYRVASTVSLDVNPSVEISVNRKSDVLSVNPLNDDGVTIIDGMDFKGSSIDVTVNALIGSMLRNGYLSDLANSILISVDDSDMARGGELQKKLADEVNELLQTNTFSGAVLSQTVTADTELRKLASDHGITAGKAQLVNTIIETNPVHTFDELAVLSINELNLIAGATASAPVTTTATVESVGQASDKAYIGGERAKEIALEHAGVTEADVPYVEIEMDYEHGTMVYEVEFDTVEYEYDYDINAATGEIVKDKKESNDDRAATEAILEMKKEHPYDSAMQEAAENEVTGFPVSGSKFITPDEAKTVALTHAGVAEGEYEEYEFDFDTKKGTSVYEIDFESSEYEFEYEINAVTGEILKSDREHRD